MRPGLRGPGGEIHTVALFRHQGGVAVTSLVYGARMESSSQKPELGGAVEVFRSGNGLILRGSSTEVVHSWSN